MHFRTGLFSAAVASALAFSMPATAQTLKLSHQWVEDKSDYRHAMALTIVSELAKAGMKVDLFGNQRLFRTREQFQATKDGTLDLIVAPFNDFAPRVREFGIMSIPGVVKDPEHAKKFLVSPVMTSLNEVGLEEGIVFLGWFPVTMSFAGAKECITQPQQIDGKSLRGPGGNYNRVFEEAGAIPVDIPTSEVPNALRVGAVDGVISTAQTFLANGIAPMVRCVTLPGEAPLANAFIMIGASRKFFDTLDESKKRALREAAAEAAAFGTEKTRESDIVIEGDLRKAGADVVRLSRADAELWWEVSKKSAMEAYAAVSDRNRRILEQALDVK